jgi:hypothetical protein
MRQKVKVSILHLEYNCKAKNCFFALVIAGAEDEDERRKEDMHVIT